MSASPSGEYERCPAEAVWVDLALGHADPARAADLHRHLALCYRCREEFGDLRALLSGMGPGPPPLPVGRLTDRLVHSWSSRMRNPFRKPGAPGLLLAGFVAAAFAVILVLIPDRPGHGRGGIPAESAQRVWEPDYRAMGVRLLGLQHTDGSWGRSADGAEGPVVLTALAALAIAAHSDPDAAEAADALKRAAQWLASQQREEGLIASSNRHAHLQHASALIALSDIRNRYRWTDLEPVIRQALEYSLWQPATVPGLPGCPGPDPRDAFGLAGNLAGFALSPAPVGAPSPVLAMLSDLLEARPQLARELGLVGAAAVRMLSRE